ncbi:MAG: DUF47 family protein [Infirmifilum sp.]|uniref:DUF47 family protein n=1 Tax=Infirmifilum uzonense TaxID=1550241 RepID=A0A0F7FIE9_9CREN|nr:DUF47 family protein [Infirmifilum uzonense]AKG39183.1 hypothetical protein MA03_07990 [Infirmifilum uzonense]
MSSVSIADAKLIAILRKELTLAQAILNDIARVLKTIEDDTQREEQKKLLENAQRMKNETKDLQTEYLSYLSKISRMLEHKEEWVRIGSRIMAIIDRLSGITNRLSFLIQRNWVVPANIKDGLINMSEELGRMLQTMDELLNKLQSNPAQALDSIKQISELENKIDSIYRSTIFSILDSNVSSSTSLLLLSVAEMLEDISDTVYDLTTNVYILLFYLL